MPFQISTRKFQFLIAAVCVIFLSTSFSSLSAQKEYTTQEILQTAIRGIEEAGKKTYIDTKLNLPEKQWIDQMEFRTELNELDLAQQEYTFRMRFKNDKVRRLQNQLFDMQLSYLENENNAGYDDGAQNIYENIIKLYFNQKLETLSLQKSNLIKDKNKLETALFKNDQSLNFNDVLKIRERAKNIQLDIFDLTVDRQKYLQSLNIEDFEANFEFSNLIDVSKISSIISELKVKIEGNPGLSLHQDRLALLEQEYRIEENDKESLLKFAQIKYQDDDKLNFEKELSFGIGMVIPYKTINQANVTKIELDRIEENFKQQDLILEMQTDLAKEKLDLLNLISKHDFLIDFIKNENLGLLKTEYLASQQVTPLPLINLELMIKDRELELLQLEQEIYLQYIDTLESVGALRFSNNTNYLDRNLSPIE